MLLRNIGFFDKTISVNEFNNFKDFTKLFPMAIGIRFVEIIEIHINEQSTKSAIIWITNPRPIRRVFFGSNNTKYIAIA